MIDLELCARVFSEAVVESPPDDSYKEGLELEASGAAGGSVLGELRRDVSRRRCRCIRTHLFQLIGAKCFMLILFILYNIITIPNGSPPMICAAFMASSV